MEIKEIVDKSRYEIPTDVELVYNPNQFWSEKDFYPASRSNIMSKEHYGFYKGVVDGYTCLMCDFNWRE